MPKLHLKGLSESIEFYFHEKLLSKLLLEFNSSRNLELSIPDINEVFDKSRLEKLMHFRKYFLQRIKISSSQKLVKFKSNIIDYNDTYHSVLKAVQEVEGIREQIITWKSKIGEGSYEHFKSGDKNKDLYFLFKYVLYFDYLKSQKAILKELDIFLNENYIEQLNEINSKNQVSKFISSSILSKVDNDDSVDNKDDLLTIDQTCKLLGKSRTTIHNWTKSGFITKYLIGGSAYYFKDEILKRVKEF